MGTAAWRIWNVYEYGMRNAECGMRNADKELSGGFEPAIRTSRGFVSAFRIPYLSLAPHRRCRLTDACVQITTAVHPDSPGEVNCGGTVPGE
jgi:hypothetical protein